MSVKVNFAKRLRLPLLFLLCWLAFFVSGLMCVGSLEYGVQESAALALSALNGASVNAGLIGLCMAFCFIPAAALIAGKRYKWLLVAFFLYLLGYGAAIGLTLGILLTLTQTAAVVMAEVGMIASVAFLGWCYFRISLLDDLSSNTQRMKLTGIISMLFVAVFLQSVGVVLLIMLAS